MTDQTNAAAPAAGEATTVAENPTGGQPGTADNGAAATPQDTDQTDDTQDERDEGEQPDVNKPPRGVTRKINKLTRKIDELTRQNHELAMAALNRGEAPRDAQQPKSAESAKPKLEDFTSYNEYQRAHEAWLEETLLTKAEKRIQDRMRTNAERQSFEAKRTAFKAATAKAGERYADFNEVVFDPDWHDITPAMVQVIAESDKAADLSYYLGTHREEAARISKLAPLAQARELGRIEPTLQPPAARKTTNAPDPVRTLGGKDSPSKDPSKMSMDEYAKWRESGGGT